MILLIWYGPLGKAVVNNKAKQLTIVAAIFFLLFMYLFFSQFLFPGWYCFGKKKVVGNIN